VHAEFKSLYGILKHNELTEVIAERQMFINSNWALPWNETIPHWDEPNNTPPNIIWYQANNKEEIIKAIEIDNLFR
jgi:hypothetical protein